MQPSFRFFLADKVLADTRMLVGAFLREDVSEDSADGMRLRILVRLAEAKAADAPVPEIAIYPAFHAILIGLDRNFPRFGAEWHWVH
jgi:hypothetical protein